MIFTPSGWPLRRFTLAVRVYGVLPFSIAGFLHSNHSCTDVGTSHVPPAGELCGDLTSRAVLPLCEPSAEPCSPATEQAPGVSPEKTLQKPRRRPRTVPRQGFLQSRIPSSGFSWPQAGGALMQAVGARNDR